MLILADTSVWIDYLRGADPIMSDRLDVAQILMHPFVRGELALGNLRGRAKFLDSLLELPAPILATYDEVMLLVEEHRLWGRGISFVDANLLASVKLSKDALLWTRDRRLATVAQSLGVSVENHARPR